MNAESERALVDAAELLARRVGLRLDHSARGRLSRCVAAAARTRGLPTSDYVARLDSDPAALQDLLDRVTVQETAFFRDPGQFEALARSVLSTLSSPITIWSAGCANGQEPYSLAMLLTEQGHFDFRVIATEISTKAIERTRNARYSTSELRGLSPTRRARHLLTVDGHFEIASALRARVEVSRHNLVSEPPPFERGSCPVVFCRNVLIYFSPDEVVRIVDRLADWIAPGGWLFLGYSESLWQLSERFDLVRIGDAFVYRRRPTPRTDGGSAVEPAERSPARVRPRRPARSAASVSTVEDEAGATVDALLQVGKAAIQSGDSAAAITAFRKSTYLDPRQPVAYLHLGLALETSGDAAAARRAYAAARAALNGPADETIDALLEGYHVDELARLLDEKLARAR